jgi:hypothetical protein
MAHSMNRILQVTLVLAMASFAAKGKVAAKSQDSHSAYPTLDVAGAITIPSVWPSDGVDEKIGMGLRVVPAVEMPLGDRFAARFLFGYEFATWGYKYPEGPFDHDVSVRTQFLTLGFAGQYDLVPMSSWLSLGVSADFPLSSRFSDDIVRDNGDVATDYGRFRGDQTSVFLDMGFGCKVARSVGLVVGYRLPLVPYYDKGETTIDLHQIDVGLRFFLP